jgi:molybdenum cofactor cytidylyltransferase
VNVAVIVLAAGLGSRFGATPKLLAELDGAPLVRRVAEAAAASRAGPVIVVLGRAGKAVRGALAGLPVRLVENPDYAQGLATSLKAGFAALPVEAAGAIVCLGDMPLLGPDILDALVDAFEETPHAAAIVPVHGGRRGNPVLLSRRLAPEIARLEGDRGAGPLLAARGDVRELAWGDDRVLVDVDTPEALAALNARRAEGDATARRAT